MSDLEPAGAVDQFGPAPAIEGEIVEGLPGRKELMLLGKAALAELGIDPDDFVDAETEEQRRRGQPENTRDTINWGFGFLVKYCGLTLRKHDPPTVGTVRQMIKDAFYMVDKDGKGRGRYGKPYSPNTIATAVYIVSMVCDRMQWTNPVRHPWVHEQLAGYKEDYEAAGHRTDESDAITHDESVALARACDLGTVQGLRLAAMLRGQFDLGCRADEWCKVRGEDLQWVTEDVVKVTFVRTKGRKKRTVTMTANRAIDWDADPVRLLTAYYQARRSAGWDGTGPLWVEVHRGDRRIDFEETGILGGRFLTKPMTYKAYALAFGRIVVAAGVGWDPIAKRRTRHITTHSNRIGMIDAAFAAGLRLEEVAARTGHAPGSKVIADYLRSVLDRADNNAGLTVREAEAAKRAAAQRGVAG